MHIVDELVQYQIDNELTDEQMGNLINISGNHFYRLKQDRDNKNYRGCGNDVWCGIINGLPQFIPEVLSTLRNWKKVNVYSTEQKGLILPPAEKLPRVRGKTISVPLRTKGGTRHKVQN